MEHVQVAAAWQVGPSIKHSAYCKNAKASFPDKEQRQRLLARTRYSHNVLWPLLTGSRSCAFSTAVCSGVSISKTPSIHTRCFLSLAGHAKSGALKDRETFISVCTVMVERTARELSGNKYAMKGMRYSEMYLNSMILMRGHGANSRK
ncbi:hypothetical protein CYLTODRAFT_427797 [Cylindrobasidium torrendii FP15055 ss-10]|uniref:Uncharacterized protein n=1 Tax=Cylindrobasidium torrendii FP15055 ss-10 TaxID=1314674 RepID=A0A0D7ARR1_9AGAR|nr:hypothetical protein CYLTODRAFT_427797 [Cylindrobasidium torrendii FP15055 ss-10]